MPPRASFDWSRFLYISVEYDALPPLASLQKWTHIFQIDQVLFSAEASDWQTAKFNASNGVLLKKMHVLGYFSFVHGFTFFLV